MRMTALCGTLLSGALLATRLGAQAPEAKPPAEAHSAEELAKKLSNPISDLVSIPFQLNWNQGLGPNDDLQFLLNIQPVVPFTLSKDWNLIARMIVPYLSQPVLFPGGEPVSGLSDITLSMFLSPRGSGRLTWGVGPVFGLPMTTDPLLGSGKWTMGATAVGLMQNGGWTYGALVNQVFSIANTGSVPRNYVSQAFLQPFIAYTTKTTFTFTLASESTYNWEVAPDQRWTVPLIGSVSKLTRLGPFPFSMQLGAGYYAAKPDDGPNWKLRMAFVVLLPRGR
jgi:hypothetical protein